MATEKMLEKLNAQITREFYSAYLYLGMEAYFAHENLDGFAHFFHVQFQEELDHAVNMFNYVNKVGGRVRLETIDKPRANYESALEVFQTALEHEKNVTAHIHDLYETAVEAKDHTTSTFLQWYITEQAEEEETFGRIVRKLELIGNDGMGLLILDKELAQRVYVPLTPADQARL